MYKLSDETKKRISNTIGIPYETLIKMDDDEITAYIEQKNHKKIRYSKPRITGSGDDSVLLDKGKFSTMETVDERISSPEPVCPFRQETKSRDKKFLAEMQNNC